MNSLKNLFIPTELSQQLIELGFDKNECIAGRNISGHIRLKFAITNEGHIISWDKYDNETPLILWDQAIDWLREKFGIMIHIQGLPATSYMFSVYKEIYNNSPRIVCKDFYKARKEAILKAIEICKNNL